MYFLIIKLIQNKILIKKMYAQQTIKYMDMEDVDIKKKIHFSNIFSKMKKSEKNKQYINLQKGLNSLSNDVTLLEDFTNKDNFSKKKNKSSNKRQYKKLIGRSKFLLEKNKNKKISILNIISNFIESEEKKKKNSLPKKKNRLIKKKINQHSVYKTEIDNNVNNNSIKLPIINFNILGKSSETLDENNTKLNRSDDSPKLPFLEAKAPKKLHLFTEENENKSLIPKQNYNRFRMSKKNINIKNNIFVKKFPNIIDTQRLKSSINRYELSRSADKMAMIMKENNLKIKNRINYKLAEQNLIDWQIKSKIKLAKWKFGIAEIEKYFVDLNAYGKPEEEELVKRKTFYDIVEELIDDIKQKEEEKDLRKIKDKYNKEEKKDFNIFEKKDQNKEDSNDLNMVDNAFSKHSEISQVLQKIKIRKLNEERTRHLIDNILMDCDLRSRAINRSTNKIYTSRKNKGMNNEIDEEITQKIEYKKDKVEAEKLDDS